MAKNLPNESFLDELNKRFTYHPPTDEQVRDYEHIRALCESLGQVLAFVCPESREKDVAFQKLDEVVMWVNAAIARRTETEDEPCDS